jgi:hypothetical protein
LLARPVFDPATFGRARLHNDNEGVVSGYLTARWLSRLRAENMPQDALFDLIFATTYGIEVIKPSMRETAAWLSIWNDDIAREAARRDPTLFVTAGDPASLSTELRRTVLTRLVEQLTSGNEEMPILDTDSVKRFAQSDISDVVRTLWVAHREHTDVRLLLLQLILLGNLKDCADLAKGTAFGAYKDRETLILAGRALTATGGDASKQRYADFIKAKCSELPKILVWNAVEDIFPRFVTIDDLPAILAKIDVTDSDGAVGFVWQSPDLVNRLTSRSELERLLKGLLEQFVNETSSVVLPDKRDESYFAAINAAAFRLLERCAAEEAPVLVIDAALRIGRFRGYIQQYRTADDVGVELHRTSGRRRLAFWRAAARLNRHHLQRGQELRSVSSMVLLGYPPGLRIEDLDWLLTDGPGRVSENERWLSIDAAVQIWREAGATATLLKRIENVARADNVMMQAYETCTEPRPLSTQEIEAGRQFKEVKDRMISKRGAVDKSWIDFRDGIRRDPQQLRQLVPTSAAGPDSRLFRLWHLLRASVNLDKGYAFDSVDPLEPMLGLEVTNAVRDGLISHWRAWRPTLKSAREPSKRNQLIYYDCMGIAGVTLEAKTRRHWAESLTSDEAELAAGYATLDTCGAPWWLADLAVAKPQEVRAVLKGEIAAALSDPEPRLRYDVLEDIVGGDVCVMELMAPILLDELEKRPDLSTVALSPMLAVIDRYLGENSERFVEVALVRFNTLDDPDIGILYAGAVFNVNAEAATKALITNSTR